MYKEDEIILYDDEKITKIDDDNLLLNVVSEETGWFYLFRFYFHTSTIFFYDNMQMILLIDILYNCQSSGKVTHDTKGLK